MPSPTFDLVTEDEHTWSESNCVCKEIKDEGQAPVAHTYNLSYSGGRDQEDGGSKPAQTNS
jgi:hypothetical protein